VLPLEQALTADANMEASDPLGTLRRCLKDMLAQLVHDPQLQRVLEIAMHKVEYVDELQVMRERRIAARTQCVGDLERLVRQAAAQGLITVHTTPGTVATCLHALMDGLLYNWLLDPSAFDLQATGSELVDTYLQGLRGNGTAGAAPVRMESRAVAH
jgi:TetR/AcrR family acrAB operon transcriptional repressor